MAGGASGTYSQIRWDAHRRAFEKYLHGLRFTVEPLLRGLEEAMRYSMLAGGKRVRPTLCMETAWIFGAEPSRAPFRGGHRAHPHLLAYPRRPSRDGR